MESIETRTFVSHIHGLCENGIHRVSVKGATELMAVTFKISTDFQNSFTAGKRTRFLIKPIFPTTL